MKYDTTNKQFSETDDLFKKCCEAANTKPCARQASKWRRQRGLAYNKLDEVSKCEPQ